MSEEGTFSLTLSRAEQFVFQVEFDSPELGTLTLDEPAPLGADKGPNASRLLGAAVGNCLSASLLFCLQKAKVEVQSMRTTVTGQLRRNERKRLRIGSIAVEITLGLNAEGKQRAGRCLELFEDYCVVTASVRQGIDVAVTVVDQEGTLLFPRSG